MKKLASDPNGTLSNIYGDEDISEWTILRGFIPFKMVTPMPKKGITVDERKFPKIKNQRHYLNTFNQTENDLAE